MFKTNFGNLKEWDTMMKKIFSLLLISYCENMMAQDQGGSEDSLYQACHDESHFCCEANGTVVKVVEPSDIFGEYNIQNAQVYCEKNYGATVSLNSSEYDQTVSIESIGQQEVADERFLEID